MRTFASFKVTAVVLFITAIMLFSHHAVAQTVSLGQLLVGTWSLTSAEGIRTDGSRVPLFGPNPKGTMIFTEHGRFALVQMRGDLPSLAANSRELGTAEENKAVVSGSIAYYGTYSIDEAEKVIRLKLEGSTYANLLGGEQRRIIIALTPDELTFTNPRNPSGTTLEVGWKRAH
jgi:hypothetical protein